MPTDRVAERLVGAVAAAVPTPTVGRISTGGDPYAAAIAVSKAVFPSGAETVILAPGALPNYGIIAAGLAADFGAPVLNVQAASIPSNVLSELRRLAPSVVIVVGSPAVIADSVLPTLRTLTSDVRRIGSGGVFDTARAVFAAGTAAADTVYLAGLHTTDDLPLATAAAAAAGKRVLAVNGFNAKLDAATITALRAAGTREVIVIQSTATILPSYVSALRAKGFTVSSIANPNSYVLSTLVARSAPAGPPASVVVNPLRPSDLPIAAATAAALRAPLYYSGRECMPDASSIDIAAAGGHLLLVGETAVLNSPVASNTRCSVHKATREAALNSAIRATMAKYEGSFTVTVRQIGGLSQVTQIGGGAKREPASMMKIFAAWAAYKRVEQGRASLSTMLPSGVRLGVCIQIMIHVSDNYCHTDIVHWIGIPTINKMIKDAGFTNTVYGTVARGVSVLYAGNRTTTNDLAWMMKRLADRTVLSKQYADALVNLMRTQIWRSRIASGIPPGTPQASKPGALWLASGLSQGDTAIVNGTRSSYIISIIGLDGPPQAALRAISRTVYTHFNGSFGTAATYPVKQMVTKTASLMRTSPGGAIALTLPVGVALQVLDAQRTWYQVQYGSRKLWVAYTGLRNR